MIVERLFSSVANIERVNVRGSGNGQRSSARRVRSSRGRNLFNVGQRANIRQAGKRLRTAVEDGVETAAAAPASAARADAGIAFGSSSSSCSANRFLFPVEC